MSLPQRIDPTSVEVIGRDIPWKRFGSCEGFVYKILDVDVERRTVDMVFHFEPSGMCFYHRHRSAVASLVLEGEHHIHEIDADGARRRKVRKAGEIAFSNDGHADTEGGGPDGAIVYFSFRGDRDHIYDILDENLDLVRAVSIQDFRTAFERW